MLGRFGRWFASTAGVWQTAVVVLAWYAAEAAGVIHDSEHFQLCVWLTIYSGVTQPVLAWVTKADTTQGDRILEELRAIATRIEAKEDEEIALLRPRETSS